MQVYRRQGVGIFVQAGLAQDGAQEVAKRSGIVQSAQSGICRNLVVRNTAFRRRDLPVAWMIVWKTEVLRAQINVVLIGCVIRSVPVFSPSRRIVSIASDLRKLRNTSAPDASSFRLHLSRNAVSSNGYSPRSTISSRSWATKRRLPAWSPPIPDALVASGLQV